MSSASPNIRTYRLDPAAFEPATKRRFRRRLAWLAPVIAGILVIEFFVIGGLNQGGGDVWPFTLLIVLAALGFGLFRAFRQQIKGGRTVWDSFELTMSENVIRKQASNLPTVEILRPEVSRIVESHGEGLTVATADRYRLIFVPEQVIGYAEVRERLSAWRALEAPKLGRSQAVTAAWTALLIGSWIGTGVIPDIRLAMVTGLVLLVVGGLTIRETLRSTFADNKTKARIVGFLGFMLLAPFARLALYFMNAWLM